MYSRTEFIGHLGGDPELRHLSDGRPVANFSVACNWAWTDQETGVQTTETTWFRVSTFGRTAEACNDFLAKGRQVFVEGRLRPDPKTGGPRIYQRRDQTAGASFEVSAKRVVFLGSKPASGDDEPEFMRKDEEREEIPF